jgi:TolA-binding protein
MLKKILLLCFAIIFSFADFEIDPDIEKHIDRYDVNSIEMIVNYYIDKNNIKKAKAINDKVLQLYPDNELALKNKKIIEKKLAKQNGIKINRNIENKEDISTSDEIPENSLIIDMKNDYQKLLEAQTAFKNKNYFKVQQILNSVKNKSALEFIKLKAYSCFEMHNYKCAKKYLSMLYSSTYSIKDAYKLIETYIKLNEKKKALKFVNLLLTQYINDRTLKKYKKELKNSYLSVVTQKAEIDNISNNINEYTTDINKLLDNYKTMPTFANLKNLVINMRKAGQKQSSYFYLNQYFLKHPESDNIKYLYAKYLYEDHKYKKAIYFLESVVLKSKDKRLVLKSKEMLGLIYYKLGQYNKAKSLLYSVSRYTTSKEVKEALKSLGYSENNIYNNSKLNKKTIPLDIVDNVDLNSFDRYKSKRASTTTEIHNQKIYSQNNNKIYKYSKIKKRKKVEKLNIFEVDSQINNSDKFSLNDINNTNIDFENFDFNSGGVSNLSKKDITIMKRKKLLKKRNIKKQTDSFFDEAFSETDNSSQSLPQSIKDFINKWKKAWESRNIDIYSQFYADKYKINSYWLSRKERIFSRVNFISLKLSDFQLLDHYQENGVDVYKVKFYQVYSTDSRVDKGYKTLTLKCVNNKCLIYKENWTRAY